MKLGVVDVGGGLRGVYAAGIFDFCLSEGFDLMSVWASPPGAPMSPRMPPDSGDGITSFIRSTLSGKNIWAFAVSSGMAHI